MDDINLAALEAQADVQLDLALQDHSAQITQLATHLRNRPSEAQPYVAIVSNFQQWLLCYSSFDSDAAHLAAAGQPEFATRLKGVKDGSEKALNICYDLAWAAGIAQAVSMRSSDLKLPSTGAPIQAYMLRAEIVGRHADQLRSWESDKNQLNIQEHNAEAWKAYEEALGLIRSISELVVAKKQAEPPFERRQLSSEDAEKAKAIYQSILEHRRTAFTASFVEQKKATVDEQERTKTTQWTAICDAHTAAVGPLKAQVGPLMNRSVLTSLWNCNQEFLKRLAEFESSAHDLDKNGRPLLLKSLEACKYDTQATNSMIQYVLNSRPAAEAAAVNTAVASKAVPVVQTAPALDKQSLLGIWDIAFPDGRRVELALDNRNFSYVLFDNSFAYWGDWSFEANPGGYPLMCLTRRGGYPVKFYGVLPFGSSDLFYADNETWGITAFGPDKVSFSNIVMTRRKGVVLAAAGARISQVQTQFRMADMQDRNNASCRTAQRLAIQSAQTAVWDYINHHRS